MLSLKSITRMIGRWCAKWLPPGHFHSAHGFVTRELAYMLDSLVRVSRRVEWTLFVSILRIIFPHSTPGHGTEVVALRPPSSDALPRGEVMLTSATLSLYATRGQCHRIHSLPFQQFQALFTPLSRYFSSFLHSTCSLSVSY